MISVCMATYNGNKYIEEQLDSIVVQLTEQDEIIIVDDGSTDDTIELIQARRDSRIKIIQNDQNVGPIGSFQIAMSHAAGDVIFLSDQDDRWHMDKVARVMKIFESTDATVVVHDAVVTDQFLNPTEASWNEFNHNHFSKSVFRTLIKNPYTGSMMAIRKTALPLILPFPAKVAMHDWWIGLRCLQAHQTIKAIDDRLMDYRRHDGSVTGKRHSLFKMIAERAQMLFALS